MVEISRLSRFLNGVNQGVDLAGNTLVVGDIKIGGGSGTLLTKTILDRLISLQNGSDVAASYHHHDGLYRTETELSSTAGAGYIGILDTATLYVGSTVEAALAEVGQDAADLRSLSGTADGAVNLGTFTGATIADNSTVKSALQSLETAHEEVDQNVNDLITLSGVAENATHLGTFSGSTIADSATIKGALQSLETYGEATRSLVQNFEWYNSVIDKDLTSPPGSPSAGDRYLIGLDTGASAATGAWAGHDGDIAEWNGSAWVFTDAALGGYVAVDDESDRLYLFGGATWSAKYFEATTASTGLVKVGFDIRLDASSAGAGLGFSGGVLSVNVDDSTVEINSDAVRVKDLGITTAKIAANAVSDAKIRLANNAYLRARNAADSADIDILKVNASDVIEFASFPQKSGTPSNANDLVNKSYVDSLTSGVMSRSVVAGESFAANTSFAVRWAVDGETAGRVYKADNDASTDDNFHVIGILKVGTALSAGDAGTLYMMGSMTLASSDSNFASAEVGLPVYLLASGAWDVTVPTAADEASVIVGYVEAVNKIDVSIRVMGVN